MYLLACVSARVNVPILTCEGVIGRCTFQFRLIIFCYPFWIRSMSVRIFRPFWIRFNLFPYCAICFSAWQFMILIKERARMLFNWKNGFQRLHPKKGYCSTTLKARTHAHITRTHAHITRTLNHIRTSLRILFCSCSFRLPRSTALQVMASTLDRAQLLDYTRAGVRRYSKSTTDACVVHA